MSVWSRDGRAREIHLEEDVYVVLGDSDAGSTSLSEWPPVGSDGPLPRDGVVGPLSGILGSIGPELWKAKREGPTVTLLSRCAHYNSATALLWGADCLEHLASQVLADDGDVAQALALARKYAAERAFEAEQAHALAAQLDKRLGRLRASGVGHLAGRVFGHALEGDIHQGATQPEAIWQAQKLAGYLDPEQTAADEASAEAPRGAVL